MISPDLQNTPHETRFPPERISFRQAVNNTPGALGWFLRNAAALVFAGGVAAIAYPFVSDTAFGVQFIVGGTVATVLVLVAWSYTAAILTNGPAREQIRYYAETGSQAPTAVQLDHLRVLAAWAHDGGNWSQTLEYHPRDVHLSENQLRRYRYLHPAPASDYAKQLDADWGVLTGHDALEMVDRILAEGLHSRHYAVSSAVEGVDLAQRLSGLTDLPVTKVMDSVSPRLGRPATYLWGYDLLRAASLVSNAYMAALVDEASAWKALEQCAGAIYALFPSEEEYLINCRIGHAFWANSLDATTQRRRAYEAYLASDWPQRRRSWCTAPESCLSEQMRTGFAQEIEEAQRGC